MKSINIIYLEMKDLYGSIIMMKEECKKVDKEWNKLLVEIKNATFNAAQGAQLYKETQKFLQERRLLKTKIEELEVQFELLGGETKLKELEQQQDFKNVTLKGKKENKYKRRMKHYKDFREDIKEEISSMYHIK